MDRVRLGKTGLLVSRVGFGGIPIQRLDDAEAVRVIQRALDLGVTFIDTANGYTTSEGRIGQAMAGRRREEVVIATKTGARDKAHAREHLELSLKRLQTEYVDLWQFHGVSTMEALEQVLGPGGAMEAAQEALQAGLIRHIGFSSHSLPVALHAVPLGPFESLQFPLNFVTDEAADELLPLCRAHDVGFIAMKPFAGGMLDNATLSIKYLLQFEGVVPDPGIEKVAEIEEIVALVNGPLALTASERQEIERIKVEVGSRFCHRCQYCLPCPQEIDIPTVMNIHSFYRRFPRERFVSGNVAAAIDGARNCAECGECETRCPYHLPIREMLKEYITFFENVAQA